MSLLATRKFTVQSTDDSEPVSRASRRIVINAEILKQAKVYAGDVVGLSAADSHQAFAVGVAWPSPELSQDSILVSPPLLLTARVTPGSKVNIFSLDAPKLPPGVPSLRNAEVAHTVRVKEVADDKRPAISPASASSSKSQDPGKGKRRDWLALLIRESLIDLGYLTPTQTLDVVYEGRKRRFAVSAVSTNREAEESADLAAGVQALSLTDTPPKLWTVGWETIVVLESDSSNSASEGASADAGAGHAVERGVSADAYASVGGLDKQIAQIRDLIEIPLTRPELFRQFGLKPPRGVLLHGPPGTGKTHLARAIAASTGSSVLIVNGPELSSAYHGETEARIRDVFAEARARSPCIIVLDEVDAICPRREEGPGGEVEKRVVAQLLTLMDGMEEAGKDGSQGKVVVVATTNRPNAIDPALRRPGRFDREIEIGIPDAEARYHIMKVLLSKAPHEVTDDDLRSIAAKAHGYVGADLSAVVREAGTLAIKRWLASQSTDAPSSKTLLVRACATESGVNFLAVKGPELLNKYVGESERAVREIFSKARAAAPSIVFFDEIDALATSRSASDSGGGAHEGVLTSLLNEMDGVQELVGVTIVAATNRPDTIDSALMRPGRLDRILYVGPPDFEGRVEILRIRTRKMSVEPGLDLEEIARMTEGCSGAEMTALCQEAALLTMKEDINAPFPANMASFQANNLFGVKGKVVLVTGGSRGIGKMIATGFVKNGAKVYISSRSAKDCEATAKELNAEGAGICIPLPADMQKLEEVERLVTELGAREKALHVLVNNAGAAWGATLDDYPDSAWTKLLTLNLQRVFTLTQKCLPLLRAAAEQGGMDGDAYRDPARIINIGSIEGISVPVHETYAYSASKAGLHQLSRHLAGRLGPEGITSNTLACGPFESKMMAATLNQLGEFIKASIPLGRIGTPEDVAGAWVTGATIQVDGGSVVRMGIRSPEAKL
ncbi:AAA-domain-containing protein [Trametes sanguinea]|nr:AAA-domain-containing protein [Trametes sanguinea]